MLLAIDRDDNLSGLLECFGNKTVGLFCCLNRFLMFLLKWYFTQLSYRHIFYIYIHLTYVGNAINEIII